VNNRSVLLSFSKLFFNKCVSKTQTCHTGAGSWNYVQNHCPPPLLRDGNISIDDCMAVCSLLKTVKITAVANAGGVWKSCGCQRVSGPSLLQLRCHQHSDGMLPKALTIDVLQTNDALPRIVGYDTNYRWCKNAQKMQRIFAYNGLRQGATTP